MKKIWRKKRIISFLLALVLLITMLPQTQIPTVSAEESTSNSEANSVKGRLGKIVNYGGKIYVVPGDMNNQAFFAATYFPVVIEIMDVKVVGSTTYYQIAAAKGYYWGKGSPYGDGIWVKSTEVDFVDVCDKCGGVDCDKVHVFCPYCAKYDCGLEHNDPYQPYIAPVIAENPTLTPGADVSLVDEWGKPVTGNFVVQAGKKYSLSAWPNLSGEVTYQWQVCYNNVQMRWVDIYGQTGKGILVNASMFRSLVDAQGITYLRCVTTSGRETMVSEPILILLDEAVSSEPAEVYNARSARYARSARSASAGDEDDGVQTVDDTVKYAVTVKYEVKNVEGVQSPEPYILYLAEGSNYVVDVEPTPVPGFYVGDAAGNPIERVTETITNIQAPITITVYYWPDYVDFEVHHYQQRVSEDKYDHVATDIIENLKTGQAVGAALAKSYEGFDVLPYDTSITVAADGSTVVNIYYDRQYFMIAIDLNGGYGAEPIYARYETPISIPNPKRTGYTFAGWENLNTGKKETIVKTMPVIPEAQNFRITYQAQWEEANTNFTVAFYYENANPETDGTYLYTFVGSVQLDGVTGTPIDGIDYADLNSASSSEHFNGYNADYAKHFETLNADKTDKNVTIKADGSTVVNVYFYRNEYELTYYEFVCQHQTHGSSCYTDVLSCGLNIHSHTLSCMSNIADSSANWPNSTWLNSNGTKVNYAVTKCNLNLFYYVYYEGSFYRIDSYSSTVNYSSNGCPGYHHPSHSSSCYTSRLSCDHATSKGYFNCACITSDAHNDVQENFDNWKIVYQKNHKYEADVSAIHKQMQDKTTGYRWTDMYFGGELHTGEMYGAGGAMGTFTSMPGGKTVFCKSGYSTNNTLFEMQYWLETYDGDVSGTRYYDGRWFKKHGEPFYTRMAYVDWQSDYVVGLPNGYEVLDCTFGDTADNGGINDPYSKKLSTVVNSDGTTLRSYEKYNNYYYVREKFRLVYINYGNVIEEATTMLMYEQPLTAEHDIRILTSEDSPYGPGYYFAGWYLDPEGTVPVDWNNTRMPDGGNTGDIGLSVYAKWLPITHEVKTYLTKDDIGGTAINTYGILHGEEYTGTVAIPEHPDGLNFIGWFYEVDGKDVAYDFSMPVYRNMNLYAKWNSNIVTSGTIYYVDTAGNQLAGPVTVTGTVGDTKTYSAKLASELGDGKTLYFPNVTSHSIKFVANADQNVFYFVYTEMKAVSYTIRFVDKNNFSEDDTSNDLFAPVTGEAKTATITYDAKGNNMLKDNYYLDKNSKEFVLSSDPALNVFYFYYTYDPGKANIQIEHYIENLEGQYEFHSEGQTVVLEKGSTVTATDYKATINGFTYHHATFNGVEKESESLSGGLTLKLYYSRNSYQYTFKFVYKENGVEKEFENSRVTSTAKYRANIIQEAKSFPGYTADSGAKSIIVDYTESNNTYTFYYTEQGVELRYYVGAVKGGSVSSDRETVSAISGTPAGSTATVKNDRYIFTGWYTDYNCTQRVGEDPKLVPGKTDGIYVAKTYYAGFKEVQADIFYQVVMPSGAPSATLTAPSEKVDIVTGIATGSGVATIPAGYEFAGWYSDAECTQRVSPNESFAPTRPGTGWANAQTYYAKFVEKKATIKYQVIGYGNVTSSQEIVDMLTGVATGSTASAIEKYGEFVGWYSDAACTKLVSDQLYFKPEMPDGGWAEEQTFYAKFKGVEYTITWEDGFGGTIASAKVEAGAKVTFPADPTKPGYTFIAWSRNDTTMPAEDVIVTAKWVTTVSAQIKNGTIDYSWGGESGTISTGSLSFPYAPVGAGAGAILIFTPKDQYRIISVTVNGERVDNFEEDSYRYVIPEGGITGPLEIVVVAALETYTVTWVVDGVETKHTYEVGAEIKPLADPTKYGYTFAGWYTASGEEYKIPKYMPAENITVYATWDRALTSLVIDIGTGWNHADEDQAFIFTVRKQGESTTTQLRVAILEDGQVKIEGLEIGATYIITLENWSWRYDIASAEYAKDEVKCDKNTITITIQEDGTLTVNLSRGNSYWLDGNFWFTKQTN